MITDFSTATAGEVIEFHAIGDLNTWAEVSAAATSVGSNTVITYGTGNTLTLTGVTALSADDVLFT